MIRSQRNAHNKCRVYVYPAAEMVALRLNEKGPNIGIINLIKDLGESRNKRSVRSGQKRKFA